MNTPPRFLIFALTREDAARWACDVGLNRYEWRHVTLERDILGCHGWPIVHLAPGVASHNESVWNYLQILRAEGAIEFVDPDLETFRGLVKLARRTS